MNKKLMFLWGAPLVLGMAVGVGASGPPSVKDGINARVASPTGRLVAKMVAIPAVAPTSGPAGRDTPSTKNPAPPAGTLGRAGVTNLSDSGAVVDGGGPAGVVVDGDVSDATEVDSALLGPVEGDSDAVGKANDALEVEDSWQQQWYRMGLTLGVLESSPDFSYKQSFRLFSAEALRFTAGQEYFGLAPRRTSSAPRYVPLAEF